mgnify:CR=1 FL=1
MFLAARFSSLRATDAASDEPSNGELAEGHGYGAAEFDARRNRVQNGADCCSEWVEIALVANERVVRRD